MTENASSESSPPISSSPKATEIRRFSTGMKRDHSLIEKTDESSEDEESENEGRDDEEEMEEEEPPPKKQKFGDEEQSMDNKREAEKVVKSIKSSKNKK